MTLPMTTTALRLARTIGVGAILFALAPALVIMALVVVISTCIHIALDDEENEWD